MKKDAAIITTLGLVGVTILSGIVLASSKAMADDSAIDNVNVTVPISCTMSSVISSGEEHAATLNPGTYSGASGSEYENGIGKTTLTTFCNDYNGFSIYAVGYTGDALGNNTLLGTTASGNATIATKVYQSGDTQSNWSMKVTKVSDATKTYNPANMSITNSFDNWHIVPDTYTKVAEYHASTGSSATDQGQGALGAKVETTYASYIAPTQPADTYSSKVKYTMVHPYNEQPLQPQPATSGCINYFANASDAVGTMGCQDTREIDWSSCYNTDYDSYCYDEDWNDIDIETLPRLYSYKTDQTLLASNFSRNGYGFAGWSDSYDYATNLNAKFYGPQETVTFSKDTLASGLSLYAVWIKSQGSIQDQSKVASVCNSLTTAPTDGTANLSSVSALTDQRDNNTYAIARLADGNCWMIENLRLESTAEHNSDGALSQGYGTSATYGNFSGLANAESENFSNSTIANSIYYSGTQSGDATINIGTSDYPSYRMPRYNNWNNQSTSANRPQNPTSNSTTNTATSAGMYSYGNYYTWPAAIADTTYYSSGDHGTTSLCPTGWRLPIGDQSTADRSFGALSVALGGPTGGATANPSSTPTGTVMSGVFRGFPNNFLYSGTFNTSSATNRGSRGYYWSSTAHSYSFSYSMSLKSSYVYPGTDYYVNYLGFSIRCTVGS